MTPCSCERTRMDQENWQCTMKLGSTAKVVAKCKLKYCTISECGDACAYAGGDVQ